jgi:hypothetical protein
MDHVMFVEASNLDDMTVYELSKDNMLDIREFSHKNKTHVSFAHWVMPAFAALVMTLHDHEQFEEFNKYWYDAILIDNPQLIIRAHEKMVQRAEQALQYLIEISSEERARQLAIGLRDIKTFYLRKSRASKEYISLLAQTMKALHSNISRITENSDLEPDTMKETRQFLEACTQRASEINTLWKDRIMDTILDEYQNHMSTLCADKRDRIGTLKQEALGFIHGLEPDLSAFPYDTQISPQLTHYQTAFSNHCDAVGLCNALLVVSCVSDGIC